MGDAAGAALSGAYVLAVLAGAALLSRAGASAETARKVVHIGLGGWWIVASLLVGSALPAAALPAAFVVVNGVAYRTRRLSFMAREEGRDTPGTVYYAASLAVLALCSFGLGAPYVGALGVLCMSFGDGLAAVAGRRFGRRRIAAAGGGKTVAGSATMFAASFLSCAFVLLAAPPVGAGMAGGGGRAAGADAAGLASGGAALGASAAFEAVAAAFGIAAVLAAAATLLELFSVDGLDNLTVPLGVSAVYVALFLPSSPLAPAAAGLALSGAVAVASLKLRLLTKPGALGAALVGALLFAIGGWPLWLVLMWFFGSSNLASKAMARRARAVRTRGAAAGTRRAAGGAAGAGALASGAAEAEASAAEGAGTGALASSATGACSSAAEGAGACVQASGAAGADAPPAEGAEAVRCASRKRRRGEPRKLRQVLANSVPALFCALGYAASGDGWLLVVAAGALAASTADTWASEVGVHSKNPPVNILTREPLQRGLSGGVSPLGLAATLVGAVSSALLATLLFRAFSFAVPTGPDAFALIAACGVAGSLLDSVLGARLQAKYRDPEAGRIVEKPPVASGAALVSGHAWVTNDAVNFMSGVAVVALGLIVAL